MDPLDKLAKSYAKLERIYRTNLLLIGGAIPVLGLGNIGLTLLDGGRHAVADAIRFGCMTSLGLVACLGATAIFRSWRRQNAEIVGLYRQLTDAVEIMDGWRPLFSAINEAHRQGLAAVIAPGELPEERQLH
jgi:hypothetical protein